jgi:hypothetical protein
VIFFNLLSAMNTSTKLRRGASAVAVTAALLTTAAQGAPKKTEPAPATEQQPAPKKSVTGKQKQSPNVTKKQDSPAAADTARPASKTASVAKKSTEDKPASATAKVSKAKADSKLEVEPAPAPEKKGFLKKLFGGKKQLEEQAAEPALAKAKTAKPVPVKDVKPVKPAPSVAAVPAAVEEPKKKRGFFSFLRGDRASSMEEGNSKVPDAEKIERPADWKDHRVVKEEAVALYEFGPSQSNGPDVRLDRGTVVTIKRVERGWALVQTNGGRSGYIDAASLRNAEEGDFAAPVVRAMATASVSPDAWAPAAPPPDLPDHPDALDGESGLLLLPPLELEPKKH